MGISIHHGTAGRDDAVHDASEAMQQPLLDSTNAKRPAAVPISAAESSDNNSNNNNGKYLSSDPKSSGQQPAPPESEVPTIIAATTTTTTTTTDDETLEELLSIKQLLKSVLVEQLAGSVRQADDLKRSNVDLQTMAEQQEPKTISITTTPEESSSSSNNNNDSNKYVLSKPASDATRAAEEKPNKTSNNPASDETPAATKQTFQQNVILASPPPSSENPSTVRENPDDKRKRDQTESSKEMTMATAEKATVPKTPAQSPSSSSSAVVVPDNDKPSNPQAVATAAALLVGTVVGSGYVVTNAFQAVAAWIGFKKPTNGSDSSSTTTESVSAQPPADTAKAGGPHDGKEGNESEQGRLFGRMFGKRKRNKTEQAKPKEGLQKSKLFGFLQNEAVENGFGSSTSGGSSSQSSAQDRLGNQRDDSRPVQNGPAREEQPKWTSATWGAPAVKTNKPEPPNNTDPSKDSGQESTNWAVGDSAESNTTSNTQEAKADSSSQTKWAESVWSPGGSSEETTNTKIRTKNLSPTPPKDPPKWTSLSNEARESNSDRDIRVPPPPPSAKSLSTSIRAVIDEYERRITELLQEAPSISTRALVDEYKRRVVELSEEKQPRQ
jgi:hypothetical protein